MLVDFITQTYCPGHIGITHVRRDGSLGRCEVRPISLRFNTYVFTIADTLYGLNIFDRKLFQISDYCSPVGDLQRPDNVFDRDGNTIVHIRELKQFYEIVIGDDLVSVCSDEINPYTRYDVGLCKTVKFHFSYGFVTISCYAIYAHTIRDEITIGERTAYVNKIISFRNGAGYIRAYDDMVILYDVYKECVLWRYNNINVWWLTHVAENIVYIVGARAQRAVRMMFNIVDGSEYEL